jgi:diguanylate cyclase (GGDEF)-like protein
MLKTQLSLPSKILLSAGILLLVGLLGSADYLTGTEIAFSVFYLLPVGLSAWLINRRMGIITSVASTFAWYLADTLPRTQPYSSAAIPIWNASTRLIMFLLVTALLAALREALQRESEFARVDYLTGAMNARAFYETMEVEIAGLARYGRPFTVLYLDVDNLKEVNDRRGHGAGDSVLKAAVAVMKHKLRKGDAVARLGGDEFAVLLRQANEEGGRIVADRIQSAFHDTIARDWQVTFSIGGLTCQTPPASVDEVIEKVDDLMYEAKRSGKDTLRLGVFREPA